jgi:hypothetical protein
MTKDDMIQVLKSVGVNENTITAMCNAFDMGVENERERCEGILLEWINGISSEPEMHKILQEINNGVRYP